MSAGENSPANGARADDVVAAEPEATSAPQKVAPEGLVLRASPRRVVRFRRGVIIGGAALGSLAIAGVTWMALGSKTLHIVEAGSEKAVSDRRTPADAVADLPGDYSKVKAGTPVLGPPLPGDLGRPILEHQHGLANQGDGPGAGHTASTAAEQAAEAERQRITSQAHQAREAGVMVQSSAHVATSSASDAAGAAVAGQPVATGEAGRLALDPDKDQNNQQRKIDFMAQQATGGTASVHRLETPASPYQLMAGSIIVASLVTGLNSDLPGMVVAQVTEPVFDTVTGRTLLIPQGSRLIGSYDSVVAFGQKRALLAWQRIILPDGSSIQIDNLPATDAAGYAGLADKVDLHSWQLLKGVALSTLLGVGTQLSLGSDESDLVRAIRQSTQQSANQAGQQIVSKNLNIQPTITVRPGWPLRIVVHKDITLRPWGGAR
ncbi:TrbI/VirB10 family protein [Sphingobium lactosutens]|uniref:Conjugal transfer protein TrbI n=1 Tax=Sphingobium lactosutens DS20 TaxID=1331060 RepID=T0H818_9SPHN|nr:TrbI/VirB10 family protein [Sphingobium lactosutens]EQB12466.1 conjugal transfer protein TrbI [Sphingobium lactosutens DS20]EQB18205.1 conjugal transfer protein TrbI [Sphingobium lactosutens DS20]